MKICGICKNELLESNFYKNKKAKDGFQYACKLCMKQYSNNRRKLLMSDPKTAKIRRDKEKRWAEEKKIRNPEAYKAISTDSLLKKTYGISLQEFDKLSRLQNNVCAICHSKCATYSRLSVDHDHETDKIRGLLCNNCNRAIGLFKDDPNILRAAADYLENTDQKEKKSNG